MNLAHSLRDFELESYFSRWEFKARHHLTASDAESLSIDELLALSDDPDRERERLLELQLAYIPSWGTDALRKAVAATYVEIEPGDVLAFAGAGEALFWAMQQLLDAGDHAISTVPNYQSIESVPLALGAEVEALPLWVPDETSRRGLRWALDLERLESMLRPNTRLLCVNFPNNPTGFVPDRETWRQLLELCHERGVTVLSDEVYRGIEQDPERTLPAAADVTTSALSVNVLSKAYGLPGLRVGWVATRNRDLLDRLERNKHYTSICNAAPAEHLATLALRHGNAILSRNRAIVGANLPRLRDFIGRHDDLFEHHAPDGGCVTYLPYFGEEGVETFCRELVERSGVFLLPGSVYRSDLTDLERGPTQHFRVGLGRRDFAEGLEQLERHLAS